MNKVLRLGSISRYFEHKMKKTNSLVILLSISKIPKIPVFETEFNSFFMVFVYVYLPSAFGLDLFPGCFCDFPKKENSLQCCVGMFW